MITNQRKTGEIGVIKDEEETEKFSEQYNFGRGEASPSRWHTFTNLVMIPLLVEDVERTTG